ncbi:hypothetical protein [Actinacidiphila sp. ITFR-21]|uniref:hypothetical protein n=1 Tax=Actinacidiphila sp. ITFR-21 TaxID=3075199 RepID=UPI00288C22DD|nr:hypothetical protein [Streptomyces sp. ITFR-21]WNI17680.1 hypothetical protein RLT57_20535 [Streptomyces sp. ITFR-21]WNI17820.1 hypothetical protein RLT57_21250 [Streptomyces sp. ITFR-21]
MQPQFEFEPTDPADETCHKFRVSLKSTGEVLGVTYLTKGAGWVTEHAGLTGKQGAVHGFKTRLVAAEFLYWFKAPEQSDRTNPRDVLRPLSPDVLPRYGVLLALVPVGDGDFLVDANTRGAGTGLGYLQRLDNGEYDVRLGAISVGRAKTPWAGLHAVAALHTTDERFVPLLKGFTPCEDDRPVTHPTVRALLPEQD